jgi:hypothetical protein
MELYEVSVPCASCHKPVGFRDPACPACGAILSTELRDALETRLEGSDIDYKESKHRIRRASWTVLFLGGVHIAWAFLVLVQNHLGESVDPTRSSDLTNPNVIVNLIIGVALGGCYFGSTRAPVTALTAALGIFLFAHGVAAVLFPVSILTGIFVKILCLCFLISGVVSALRAAAVLKRLTNPHTT